MTASTSKGEDVDEPVKCKTCGTDCSRHFLMCDETEGEFCPECFDKLNCEEKHGEGCATSVFSDGSP